MKNQEKEYITNMKKNLKKLKDLNYKMILLMMRYQQKI